MKNISFGVCLLAAISCQSQKDSSSRTTGVVITASEIDPLDVMPFTPTKAIIAAFESVELKTALRAQMNDKNFFQALTIKNISHVDAMNDAEIKDACGDAVTSRSGIIVGASVPATVNGKLVSKNFYFGTTESREDFHLCNAIAIVK